uniref:protein PIGMENT DEFECTIVE 338, chloroplastic n=1 Tax=Erigeron canadensis TaxID=72917 RepID=UPI001CB9362F|nr:protein PIGMENT DEFECTIVE 338, chloroplastic [Erigeron canadensis]
MANEVSAYASLVFSQVLGSNLRSDKSIRKEAIHKSRAEHKSIHFISRRQEQIDSSSSYDKVTSKENVSPCSFSSSSTNEQQLNTHHHVLSCSNIDEIQIQENDQIEELGLLGKPSPKPINVPQVEQVEEYIKPPDKDDVLEPFYKFFRDGKSSAEDEISDSEDVSVVDDEEEEEDEKEVSVEYYDPQQGDFVVGVVVSGNEYKLDVNIGADLLATMLTKEVLPLYDKELDFLLCDMEENAAEFMMNGKMGIVKNEEALSTGPGAGQPVVEHGTVLFAEVLGRTLSGRPLISTRRFFRRLAWHRVRQIKQFNEPIEVKVTEWNTGGLLTRIEGLRAFLPKVELVNRVNNFTELKENVGRRMYVQITRISEDTNDLILSQKDAWNAIHLKEGTLLEGTVRKIFPYGAQIRIGETNRSGLLHISNITRGELVSVSDVLALDEKVKVLVVKSMFPDKISLSTAELESEPGLFLRNKEKVYLEAAEMAKKYKQKLPAISTTRKLEHLPSDALLFTDEESMYANWKWFKF